MRIAAHRDPPHLQASNGASCSHCAKDASKRRWQTQPRQWVVRVILPILIASLVYSPIRPAALAFWSYVKLAWWAIGLGLLLGGVIERFIPREYVSRFLSKPSPQTVFFSVGLGFLFSGCSHGCLALSMELHKKGAAPASVIGFLLASPWASLSLTLVLMGLFGLKGLVIVCGALGVAILTGLVFLRLASLGLIEQNPNTIAVDAAFSIGRDIKQRAWHYRPTLKRLTKDVTAVCRGAWILADMVIWWLIIGFFLASLLGTLIPHAWFVRYMGQTVLGLLVTMCLATIVEICSEGSAPLAFELYKHTHALGNSFAFLMGGVVTDATELGLVWTNIGKKTALWMLALTLPQVFLLALALNRW